MDEKLPMPTEQPADEERTWRDVAQRWKEVGKQVKDLGERLGSAFREGWTTDEVTEERPPPGRRCGLRAMRPPTCSTSSARR